MQSELNLRVVIDHDENLPFAHASDLTDEITRRVRQLVDRGDGFYEVAHPASGRWNRRHVSGPVEVTLNSAFLARRGG